MNTARYEFKSAGRRRFCALVVASPVTSLLVCFSVIPVNETTCRYTMEH